MPIPNTPHQFGPSACDSLRIPAGSGGFTGETVAGHRRDDHIKGILPTGSMGDGIRQRTNEAELFRDRPRPTMSDDHGQGTRMTGTDVDEMYIQSVDRRDELREAIQPGLQSAPVVVCSPVTHEL